MPDIRRPWKPPGRFRFLAAVLAATVPAPASASADRTEGTVLQIQGNELLVDIGVDDGVSAGEAVRIYRRIVVQHPVTRRSIEDRFPIGDETIEQVATRMSIIVLDTPVTHPPAVGDAVVLVRADSPVGAAGIPEVGACPVCDAASCPVPPPCPVDAERDAVLEAFARGMGRSLLERIAIWEQFLSRHGSSEWAPSVTADLESLRAMLREARGGTPAVPAPAPMRIGHTPPSGAYVGEPVEIAIAVDPRGNFQVAQFHVRREGAGTYQTIDMVFDGDHYMRVLVPPEFVQEGGFEYCATAVARDGAEVAVAGRPGTPIRVPVSERTEEPAITTDRSRLSTSFEYVDFFYRDVGLDYYLRFETDFRYTLGTWFYALRMGFGILDGGGGPVDLIDRDPVDPLRLDPQPISYRYGFTEVEIRLHEIVYLIGRLSFGSARSFDLGDGRSRAPEALVGGSGKIRIGRPDGTNLVFGGGYIEELGYEALVTVDLGILEDFPIRGHVIVTDMPVEADLGVRLVAEAGWRPTSWFELTGLAGYNIRTINHAGFSLGLGAAFQW